jgi:hypothetical protein
MCCVTISLNGSNDLISKNVALERRLSAVCLGFSLPKSYNIGLLDPEHVPWFRWGLFTLDMLGFEIGELGSSRH